MQHVPFALMGLDLVACAVTLLLVAFFLLEWGRLRDPASLLLAAGFALVAGSFLTISASTFDLDGSTAALDGARLAGQTGGAFVILLALLARRLPRGAAALALGWSVVAASLVGAGAFASMAVRGDIPLRAFVPAHAAQTLAYACCVVLAAGRGRGAALGRTLLPLGFVAWALSKFTWLLIDLTEGVDLVPYVYALRFAALALMLLALLPREDARGSGAAA